MQDRQSSAHKPQNRFSGLHLLATSFAALAGVGITGYQVIMKGQDNAPPPVQVTVAVEPLNPAQQQSAVADASTGSGKGDVLAAPPAQLGLAAGASFTAALHDGSEQRYDFKQMFDGDVGKPFEIKAPDSEVNVLMSFAGGASQSVSAIEYQPPAGEQTAATQLDVMVLPDGQIGGSGQSINSFTLQTTPGKQSFSLPQGQPGKAIWIRVAGPAGQGSISVGKLTVLK